MKLKLCFAALLNLLILMMGASVSAQSYKTAGGIRIDNGVNFTVQQYIKNGWTAEGILHAPIVGDNVGLTLLGEKHHKILFRNFNVYSGAGIHYYGVNDIPRSEGDTENNVFGLSGIAGAEFSIGRINLAFDWKPELHLTESAKAFDWSGASVSVRYIFAKRERKKVKDWKVWDKFERNKNSNNNKRRGN